MPLTYKEAFGLTDNPFGPRRRVGALPKHLTASLEKQPLLLHQHDDLEKLYCDKISSFQTACQKLDALLEADGYAPASDDGVASYLIAVEGDRGAGKTTLACRMLRLMLKRYPKDQPAPKVEEVLLKSSSQTVTEQIEKLKTLEVKTDAEKAPYRCILIDDLLAEAYPYLAELYDNLSHQDASVFMIFTSCDPKMAEQIDKSLHSVQRYSIGPLTADDAIAYVNARYQFFRVPSANGLNAEPLFPFDEADIRTAVAVRVLKGADAPGPVNLRLVACVLSAALTDMLQKIADQNPAFDLHALPPGELAAMKVRVAEAYEMVVRK